MADALRETSKGAIKVGYQAFSQGCILSLDLTQVDGCLPCWGRRSFEREDSYRLETRESQVSPLRLPGLKFEI